MTTQHRRARRRPSAATTVVVASTLIDLSWVWRDHTSPPWDQAQYLANTLIYQQALDHHGPVALFHAVYNTDPGRAPLLSLAMLPLSYPFGPGPGPGLVLNLVLWPVVLVATGAIAARLFGGRARLPAILLLVPMPLVVYLAHTDLQDFLLLALTVVSVWLLLRAERFTSLRASIALGTVMALGSLCKFSFALGVAGPLAVTVVAAALDGVHQQRRDGHAGALWAATRHLALALGIAASPFAFWYTPNWSATEVYLRQQVSDQAGSIHDPLGPAHLANFVVALGDDLSWLAVAVAVGVTVFSVPWLARRFAVRGALDRRTFVTAAFVLTWLVVPVVVVAANVNQDPRYDVAAYPALAVLVGGLVARGLRPAAARVALAVMAAACLLQVLEVNAPAAVSFLPSRWSVSTGFGMAVLPLAASDGVALPPSRVDVTMEVLEALEHQIGRRPVRGHQALVAVAEDDEFANSNALRYDASLRHDPYQFVIVDTPAAVAHLAAILEQASAVLYVRQAPVSVSAADGRVGQINVVDGARHMTPAQFALFDPHPERIHIGVDAGQSAWLSVLVRRTDPVHRSELVPRP